MNVHDRDNLTVKNSRRGTLPDAYDLCPAGRTASEAEICWYNKPFDGVLRGHIFTDGSAYQGGTPAARAGWALGQTDERP